MGGIKIIKGGINERVGRKNLSKDWIGNAGGAGIDFQKKETRHRRRTRPIWGVTKPRTTHGNQNRDSRRGEGSGGRTVLTGWDIACDETG